jgi:predicted MFS family arabinose efflux permease
MAQVPRVALLALAVGLVLADSSVVTLGLPDVLAAFDATPSGASWVLTAYNLVLALAALPAAALAARVGAASLARVGLAVFAVASLGCAVAPSLGALVAARAVQGLGGAAVAVAALPLLVAATGDRARGTTAWAVAGAIGAAVGPAAGGLLTEALAWEAIFAVQVPVAVACLAGVAVAAPAAPPAPPAAAPAPSGDASRPAVPALLALAALGAGLTAALFLLVLLLIAGWRASPLAAALTVTVMPLAALAAGRLGRGLDDRARGAAGAVLVAGGLAALGLLPEAGIAWTILPQALIGLGLGLSLDALTEAAVRGRAPLTTHGAWTIAARHAGIVVALALLTPLFTADLEREEERAEERGLALVLDAPIAPATKLSLGLALAERIDAEPGRVPDVGPAFAAAAPRPDPADAPALDRLETRLDAELDRAATDAFSRAFLIGAVLAALAAVPLLLRAR